MSETTPDLYANTDGEEGQTLNPEANDVAPRVRVFRISQTRSRVRFEIDEELRGEPKTVVGTTDQVAGEIALDFSNLSRYRRS